MTKKPVFWIALVLAAAFIVTGAVWAKQYYEDRYVGSDYYVMVPLNYDITPEMVYSNSGEEIGLGKTYDLTAYNELGEKKEVNFLVLGDDQARYPQPGAFLLVKASKQIVLSWSVTEKSAVPQKALTQIGR